MPPRPAHDTLRPRQAAPRIGLRRHTGGATVGSKAADGDNKLRKIELWLNAALLVIAAIGVIAIGAFVMQFVAADTPNPPAAARAASPVSVPTPQQPVEVVAPASPAAPVPVTTVAPAISAPPAAAEAPSAEQPSAATIAEPASPPPPAAGRLPISAPPATRPAPVPARAAPAPRADDITRRRCAALADYVADLNRQGGANPPPWVGEQIDTAVSRQRELGC